MENVGGQHTYTTITTTKPEKKNGEKETVVLWPKNISKLIPISHKKIIWKSMCVLCPVKILHQLYEYENLCICDILGDSKNHNLYYMHIYCPYWINTEWCDVLRYAFCVGWKWRRRWCVCVSVCLLMLNTMGCLRIQWQWACIGMHSTIQFSMNLV